MIFIKINTSTKSCGCPEIDLRTHIENLFPSNFILTFKRHDSTPALNQLQVDGCWLWGSHFGLGDCHPYELWPKKRKVAEKAKYSFFFLKKGILTVDYVVSTHCELDSLVTTY